MATRHPEKDRPVLVGLLALVGVAVAIGLLGGLAVMVGVKATGLDGTTTATDESASPSSFTLPKPSDTGSSIPPPEETFVSLVMMLRRDPLITTRAP